MPRPPKRRHIGFRPGISYFKPQGVSLRDLDQVSLGLDELEAIRLSDLEGHSQEQAGQQMSVSRATVGRILESAHRKIAEALTSGLAIRIEGGPVKDKTSGDDMPGFDRTGPNGAGSRTGRGAGQCGPNAQDNTTPANTTNAPAQTPAPGQVPGRGLGRGPGKGRGGGGGGGRGGRGGGRGR